MPAALALALIAFGGCDRRPVAAPGGIEAFAAHLEANVPGLLKRYGVPGATVALVCGGKPAWSGAYGYADLESGRRMAVDSICRVESISKSVTAWGVMALVERGLIGLDDPVLRHLGDWQPPGSPVPWQGVTIRRLLSGNAGLPLGTIGESVEYAPGSETPSLREHLALEARLDREPGSGFEYSNVGFNLLELLVEEVSGRDFGEYMREEVLLPLGMSDSDFDWRESMRARLPTGYDLAGEPVPPYLYPARASGGLFATVEDVARFAAAGMSGPGATERGVLGLESIRRLHEPELDVTGIFAAVTDAYGFGHFVEFLPDGRTAAWHGGQGHGWMTHFHLVPESGDGIVILANSQRSWPFMARVLDDWAAWSGLGSVKMGRITTLTDAFRLLVGLTMLLAVGLLIRLVLGLRGGSLRWAPLAGQRFAGRLAVAGLGAAGIAALAWAASRPYLFVTSVFPSLAGWAAAASLLLALMMILSALCPRRAVPR